MQSDQSAPGLMATFDFKKAFDLISCQFLTEAPRSFNFGESFINSLGRSSLFRRFKLCDE